MQNIFDKFTSNVNENMSNIYKLNDIALNDKNNHDHNDFKVFLENAHKLSLSYDELIARANTIPDQFEIRKQVQIQYEKENKSTFDVSEYYNEIGDSLSIPVTEYFDRTMTFDLTDTFTYQNLVRKLKQKYIVACDYLRMIYVLRQQSFSITHINFHLENFNNRYLPGPICITNVFDGICKKISLDGTIWLCKFAFFDENDYAEDGNGGALILSNICYVTNMLDQNMLDQNMLNQYNDTNCRCVIYPRNYECIIHDSIMNGISASANNMYKHYFDLAYRLGEKYKEFDVIESQKIISRSLKLNSNWNIQLTSKSVKFTIFICKFWDTKLLLTDKKINECDYYKIKDSHKIISDGYIEHESSLLLDDEKKYYLIHFNCSDDIDNVFKGIDAFIKCSKNQFGWIENKICYDFDFFKKWMLDNNFIDSKRTYCTYLNNKLDICKNEILHLEILSFIHGYNLTSTKIKDEYIKMVLLYKLNDNVINFIVNCNENEEYSVLLTSIKSVFEHISSFYCKLYKILRSDKNKLLQQTINHENIIINPIVYEPQFLI